MPPTLRLVVLLVVAPLAGARADMPLAGARADMPLAGAQADAPPNRLPAERGCAAPALLPAAMPRQVQDDPAPPPFRLAVLACPTEAAGPPKRRLRRT